jgi:hypothetical protein
MTFEDLEFKQVPDGRGIQAEAEFDNGYGASVVQSEFTYGGKSGFYELAVTKGGRLCYDTPITDNVCGFLTEAEVTGLLVRIEGLKG